MTTITISEDFNASVNDDFRFCATVDSETEMDRAGFGKTEIAALSMLIEAYPKCARPVLANAAIERMGVR